MREGGSRARRDRRYAPHLIQSGKAALADQPSARVWDRNHSQRGWSTPEGFASEERQWSEERRQGRLRLRQGALEIVAASTLDSCQGDRLRQRRPLATNVSRQEPAPIRRRFRSMPPPPR